MPMDSKVYAKSQKLPFYAFPTERQSSAEIIRNAKANLCLVNTARPYTPQDFTRSLYSRGEGRTRPPSNLSLDSFLYDGSEVSPRPGKQRHRSKVGERRSAARTPMDLHLEPTISQMSIAPARKSTVPRLPSHSVSRRGSLTPGPSRPESPSLSSSLSSVSITSLSLEKKRRLYAASASSNFKLQTYSPTPPASCTLEGLAFKLEFEIKKGINPEHVKPLLSQLKKEMEELHWSKVPERPRLLKVLFRWLEPSSPELCLQVAHIILEMKVSGNNLMSICKLIYKFSKSSNLDAVFANNPAFLGSYVRALHSSSLSSEGLLYAMASLKFLSSSSQVLIALDSARTTSALLFQLNHLLSASSQFGPGDENILPQIVGGLRNLADVEGQSCLMLPHLSCLLAVLASWGHHQELVFSTTRLLSKLSEDAKFCEAFVGLPSYAATLLDTLAKYKTEQEIVVRLAFLLGSLLGHDRTVALALQSGLPLLAVLLKLYAQMCATIVQCEESNKELEKDADVLVKVLRVLANMALHPDVGKCLACSQPLVVLVLNITDLEASSELREAISCALVVLNNLSFYLGKEEDHPLGPVIAKRLWPLMTSEEPIYSIEAGHILQNLSGSPSVRTFLVMNQAVAVLLQGLDSARPGQAMVSCQLLANLLQDHPTRLQAASLGLVGRVLPLLQGAANLGWLRSGLLCQLLWNLSCGDDWSPFSPQESQTLALLLDHTLSVKKSICQEEPEWQQDFKPYAEDLFNRLLKSQK